MIYLENWKELVLGSLGVISTFLGLKNLFGVFGDSKGFKNSTRGLNKTNLHNYFIFMLQHAKLCSFRG